MSTFDDLADDSGLCAKAALHFGLSREYLERYLQVSQDPIFAGALFCAAAVKYVVPFTLSITSRNKRIKLDHQRLSQAQGFDQALHEHLLELRNRLVAHDDLGLMKPRTLFLQSRHMINGVQYSATRSVGVANKAVHRPTALLTAEAMLAHIAVCEIRARDLVYEALDALQQRAIAHPQEHDQWRQFYDETPGNDDTGSPLPFPELHGHPRFSPPEPTFDAVKDGYFYSGLNFVANYEPPYPVMVKGQMVGIMPTETDTPSPDRPD